MSLLDEHEQQLEDEFNYIDDDDSEKLGSTDWYDEYGVNRFDFF